MQSHLYEFFVHAQTGSKKTPIVPWLKQTRRDLCLCFDCMEEYHTLVENAFNCNPNFFGNNKLQMKKVVYESDVRRLENYLDKVLEDVEKGKGNTGIGAGGEAEDASFLQTQSAVSLKKVLECPLVELMRYPRLLLRKNLSKLLVDAFKVLQDVDQSLEITEKYPGVYLLLVHPEYEVCFLYLLLYIGLE